MTNWWLPKAGDNIIRFLPSTSEPNLGFNFTHFGREGETRYDKVRNELLRLASTEL